MMKFDEFKKYLYQHGYAEKTVSNNLSYLKRLLKILNNIDEYKSLDNNSRIKKFSKVNDSYKIIFDKFHNYNPANDSTFSNYRNTANKYVTYLETINNENIVNNINQTHPLNQILYGPPGTGKTYHTINRALEIIDRKFYQENKEDRTKLTDKFKQLKDDGQIEFITFHQSYGYEEFVEGIKANTNEDGNINYSVEAGIFKTLSNKAKENFRNSQAEKVFNLQELISDFIYDIESKLDNTEYFLNDKVTIKEINKNKDGDFISFTLGGSVKSDQRLTKDIVERDLKRFIDGEISSANDIKPKFESKNKRHGNAIYYYTLFESIKNFFDKNKTKYYTYTEKLKNYILIIDEINRGNISKIFGELITLIEPSKRLGAAEEIKVKLPNSPELFCVPQNLYIIGTMNTADRSIAQIDTALRRRFVFEEMMPKPEVVKDVIIDGIEVSKILEAINERIEYIYDREHTIGHSYFMPLKEIPTKVKLDEIFRVNIIPLLAEYFYSDWEDIQFILNNNFIIEKDKPQYLQKSSRQLNKVYKVNDEFKVEEYIKIYSNDE